MKGLPTQLPRPAPRMIVALVAGLALAVALGVAGPLLSVGNDHPLAPGATRAVLVVLVVWASCLWGARRSLLGPSLGLGCLLIAQGGGAFAWAGHRPLRPYGLRLLLIGLILVAYLAWLGWRAWRDDTRAHELRKLLGALRALMRPAPVEQGPARMHGALARHLQAVQGHWRQLHARAGWRGRLDAWRSRRTLPWYLVLGARGCGKSSVLATSNLRLLRGESAQGLEAQALGLSCWIGEGAIFVESSGVAPDAACLDDPGLEAEGAHPPDESPAPARPGAGLRGLPVPRSPADEGVGPDGAPEAEEHRWGALLQGLRGRGGMPALHGLVLVVDIPLLLQGGPEALAQSALCARRHLLQLRAALGVALPVHLVLTKADALPGFEDFFAALDAHARQRDPQGLWGFVVSGSGDPGAALREELELLRRRLEQWLPACLEQEFSLQARCRMYELPHAYAEFATRLRAWVETVFAPWPELPPSGAPGPLPLAGASAAAPGLHGVFLGSCTSCTSVPPLPCGPGRFVAGILQAVLATDVASGLAQATGRARRRRRRVLAAAASLLVAAMAWRILQVSQVQTRQQLQALRRHVGGLQALMATAVRQPSQAQSWEAALRGTQDLHDAFRTMRSARPLGAPALHPVREATRMLAMRLQTSLLLPRLGSLLREHLQQAMQQGDVSEVFTTLRSYLLLHDPEHFEAPVLLSWARRHGAPEPIQRALEHPAGRLQDPTALDSKLVQRAREWLLRRGRPQRLWTITRERMPAKLEPPEYSLALWQGQRAERPFRLASGRPLTRGVPGWFRSQAWDRVVAQRLPAWAAQAGAVDRWVLGDAAGMASDEVLTGELRHAYWREYARHWSAFLGDIRPQPMPGVEPELQYLQAMASESSPLLDLVSQAWQELQPLRAAQAAASDPVAARLLELQALAPGEADPAALQRLRGWLDDYYTATSVAASALRAGRPPGAELEQASAKLQATSATLPAPVGPIVRGLADDAMTNLRGAAGAIAQGQAARMHARIVDAFQEQVAQPCARTLGNRFPLRRDGADADLEDFRAFFAPGGAADSFFRGYLQPWVDTGRRPWRYRSDVASEEPGSAQASDDPGSSSQRPPTTGPVARELLDMLRKRGPDPEAFARVAQVRSALWRNGAGPLWNFDLSIPVLDTRWAMLHLDLDGVSMRYAHGPVLAWHASWPPQHPESGHARLRFEGLEAGDGAELDAQGPWAWMHLLAQGRRLGAASGGGLDLAYGLSGRRAVLHLAGPEPNPWKAGLLEGLQCPR